MNYSFNDELFKLASKLAEIKANLSNNENDKDVLEFINKLAEAINKYNNLNQEEKYYASQIMIKSLEGTALVDLFNMMFQR